MENTKLYSSISDGIAYSEELIVVALKHTKYDD